MGSGDTWRLLSIDQCCHRVTSGGTPSRRSAEFYVGGTVPWIKTGELRDKIIDPSKVEEFITEEALAKSSAKLLPIGTVLMAMYGDGQTIGSLGLLRSPIACNQACCAMIPNTKVCDPLFLFYAIRVYRDDWIKIAHGGAQRNLSGTIIKARQIRVPDLVRQHRIAAILSAYDELIENNTRRIAILEEMARRLYEEWFVHFRFPGHEETEFDGELPEGWREVTLAEVASVNPEAIKPKSPPERLRYIDIASVSPGRIDTVQELAFAEAPGRARRIVRDGDVIWSCVRPNRRSFALVLEPAEDTVASTGFAVLRAVAVPFTFIYCSTSTDAFVDYLTNNTTGSAYPAVKQSDFEKAELVVPSFSLLTTFDEKVQPMLRLADTLHRKNANLRAQRDMLLPKLISGEIDVSGAETVLEAAE